MHQARPDRGSAAKRHNSRKTDAAAIQLAHRDTAGGNNAGRTTFHPDWGKIMNGTAYVCDKDLLQLGMPCIIQVDSVNSPTGLWWGEVTAMEARENYLNIDAKITGGRFQLKDWKPVKSDEENGHAPSLNYRVYPDTETTRTLFEFAHRAEAEAAEANARANHWRRAHLDVIANTMAHLVREGLVVAKKKAGGE